MDKLLQPRRNTMPSSSSAAEDTAPLKLGDGIIFYDERDKPLKGTVRWVGVNKVVMPSGARIVGIETVSWV